MRDQLLAYLLDDADPEQRRRIEEHLANDPTWQHEYEKLKQCLEAHQEPPEKTTCPPPDLVDRTCSLVRKVSDSQCDIQLSESSDGCKGRRRWSAVDLIVAASVLVAIGALLFPALVESRRMSRRLQCQDNLKEIGRSLVSYQKTKGNGLPHVRYRENAGVFVIELADSGVISREELARLLICPSTHLADDVFQGTVVLQIPTRESLDSLPPDALRELQKVMAGSYAYQFGFVNEKGKYQAMPFFGRSDVPMLGDSPDLSAIGYQSSNHGDCGQNIINQDESSRFVSHCDSQDCIGHPFLNDAGQHAAGRSVRDAVLGRSEATPAGNLIRLQW